MKKGCLFIIMMLLAACGSGGGGGATVQNSGGTAAEATGILSVNLNKGGPKSVASLPTTQPQAVRVVVKDKPFTNFKVIKDVDIGDPAPSFTLPTSKLYTVEVITFAREGSLNRMINYGAADQNAGAGIVIVDGGTTTISINPAAIAPPALVLPVPATVIYAGDPVPVSAGTPAVPLQTNWSVKLQTSDFTAFPHITGTAPTVHSAEPMPTAQAVGTLYAMGEFYLDASYLNVGESATSWVICNLAPTSRAFSVHGTTFGNGATGNFGDLFHDVNAPTVSVFAVPGTQTSTTLTGVIFGATDNVGVTNYCIAEGDNQDNCASTTNSSGWSLTNVPPTTYNYKGAATPNADNTFTLYAFARDAAGNVSASKSAPVTITPKRPRVMSFTVPAGPQIGTTIAPIAITGKDNAGVDDPTDTPALKYLVTQTPVQPLAAAFPATAGTSTSYNVTGVTLDAGVSMPVKLYAWAMDSNGVISLPIMSYVTINDAPQVTSFVPVTPVASGKTVSIPTFVGAAKTGASIAGYLVTTSGATPIAASFTLAKPTDFTYTGVNASIYLYSWVIDSRGIVSLSKSPVLVHFTNP